MIEVIHGDALEFEIAHASKFQALITDPPYSEHVHANITSAGTMGKGSRGWHRQDLGFEALTPELLAHIAAFAARVQGWALTYSDFESAHAWRTACEAALSEYIRTELVELEDDAPAGYDGLLPWERWSQPQKSGDRPTQGFEVLTICWGRAHSRKAWNGPGSLTCLRHKCLRGSDKHRAEKPLDQLLDLVSWFSNAPHLPWAPDESLGIPGTPGFTARPAQDPQKPVLDPCSGAGTTATACALLGRPCVAFELDGRWADEGERRAQDALRGVLSNRDRERAERWVMATLTEAQAIPFPTKPDGSDVKTWERAQRRIADATFVGDRL